MGRFLSDVGMQGQLGVKHMESRFDLQMVVLRDLRGLLTPQSRKAAANKMLEKHILRKSFEEGLRDIIKDQWVEFVWSQENPMISEDVSVSAMRPPSPCLLCCTCLGLVWVPCECSDCLEGLCMFASIDMGREISFMLAMGMISCFASSISIQGCLCVPLE